MNDHVSHEELQRRLVLAADALRRSEQQATAGRLALELMHEINNPLETLGYLNHLTLHSSDDASKVLEYMTLAEEQMSLITEITRKTLGFAQVLGSPKPFDLAQVAEAALRIHQRNIDAKSVTVVRDLSSGLVVPLYKGELLQVVSNLIANALDALPDSGILHVRLKRCHGKAHLVIADNGSGIADEHKARLFEPFFSTKEDRGTDLGLAVSRRIVVERHLGCIKVRSSVQAGRTGTTFRISLPC